MPPYFDSTMSRKLSQMMCMSQKTNLNMEHHLSRSTKMGNVE